MAKFREIGERAEKVKSFTPSLAKESSIYGTFKTSIGNVKVWKKDVSKVMKGQKTLKGLFIDDGFNIWCVPSV